MNKNQGFTLIELIISMALGLLISMMVMQLLVSSNRTAALNDGILQAQETGRFAVSYLSSAIQKAGFSKNGNAPRAFMAGGDCNTPLPAYCIQNETGGDGDRIAIIRTSTAEDNQTCNGTALGVANGTPVIDVFYVESNELKCATYNYNTKIRIGTIQSIINNVQALQILYGVEDTSLSSDKSNVTRYLNASDLTSDTDWIKVKIVKFSLLTRGNEDNTVDRKNRRYILLDANPYDYDDQVARQIFTTSTMRMN